MWIGTVFQSSIFVISYYICSQISVTGMFMSGFCCQKLCVGNRGAVHNAAFEIHGSQN